MGESEQADRLTSESNVIETFSNFRILKELSNISNLVSNEEFLEIVPKIKSVKWVPMFNCLKQDIFNTMVDEISSMWELENMPEKLEILDKLKEKYSENNPKINAWRPQQNDVMGQLRAYDIAHLQQQKMYLESLVQQNESKVNSLKNIITAKRVYLKALQMDIHNYQKKNEQLISKLHEKLKNHGKLTESILRNKFKVNDIVINGSSKFEAVE